MAVPSDGRVYGDGFRADIVGVVITTGSATQRVNPGQRLRFFGLNRATGYQLSGITTDIAAHRELARHAESQPPAHAIATLSVALTLGGNRRA